MPDEPPFLLPFPSGTSYMCTQGPGGSFSHSDRFTVSDLDFDTPATPAPVVATSSGIAYLHPGSTGFGNHVNIDFGVPGYFDLASAHLSSFAIENGQRVVVGQLIGWSGNTGFSKGTHIHTGRHQGDPAKDALQSVSVPSGRIIARDWTENGLFREFRSDEFSCALVSGRQACVEPNGHCYESGNGTTRHMSGTVVKLADRPEIYLVAGEEIRWITNEDNFLSRRLYMSSAEPWRRVVDITEPELSCYRRGADLDYPVTMRFARCRRSAFSSERHVYLTVDDRGNRSRRVVPVNEGTPAFVSLLRSWGFDPSEILDGWQGCSYADGPLLALRDGTIVQEASDAKFWAIANDGHAYRLDPALAWAMNIRPEQVIQLTDGTTVSLIAGVDPRHRAWTRDDAASCRTSSVLPNGDGLGQGGAIPTDEDAGSGTSPSGDDGGSVPPMPDAGGIRAPSCTEGLIRTCDYLCGIGTIPGLAQCGASGEWGACERAYDHEVSCTDGIDNDCRNGTDGTDPSCAEAPPPAPAPASSVPVQDAGSPAPDPSPSPSSTATGTPPEPPPAPPAPDASAPTPAPAPTTTVPPVPTGAPPSCGHSVRFRFSGYGGEWQFGADVNPGWYTGATGTLDRTATCVAPGWHTANGYFPSASTWMCNEWPLGSFNEPYGRLEVSVDGVPIAILPWHDPSIPGGVGCNLRYCVGPSCS